MDDLQIKIKNSVDDLFNISRSNKRKTFLLIAIAIASVAGALASFFTVDYSVTIIIMLSFFIFSYVLQLTSKSYKSINQANIIEHINCTFLEFEQSSQLLLVAKPQSILQQLQKQKIETLYLRKGFIKNLRESLQPVQYQTAFKILIISMIVFSVQKFSEGTQQLTSKNPQNSTSESTFIEKTEMPVLLSSKIKVTFPEYMNLQPLDSTDMNLNIYEGAKVHWELVFSRDDVSYFMVNTDGQKIALNTKNNNFQTFDQLFKQTSLYSFGYSENGEFKSLDNVYTIEIIADQIPKIKIINPKQSLVELPKEGPANFELTVEVTDDFGLKSTYIQASVASGSGEAVKFRDEVFEFDSSNPIEKGKIFTKNWNLHQLQMVPGDEVYFKVIANDIKKPNPQQSKSASVIVRWLEDDPDELSAEGLQIQFVPEYFRSQRQIIIETEQLIEDRNDLSQQQFDETSVSLGHSQNDLKVKYGQYLGDEVGEGPGDQRASVEEHHDDHSDEDSTGEHSEGAEHRMEQPEAGHAHEKMVDQNDHSGASELISRFAHNHGSAEIGPISNKDPKTWMKKAVHEMWQAELHLMLSEPEKALDFEYKAYDYLKLATAAERVYIKRLGFEPPPVNEDRRLTGEQKDILNYSKQIEDKPDEKSDVILLQRSYSLLSTNSSPLNPSQQALLKQLKQRFLDLSKSRPALIKQAAIIERILSSSSFSIKNCKDCISSLKQKIWQLMPKVVSLPNTLNGNMVKTQDVQYQTKIQFLKKSYQKNLARDGEGND